MAESPQPYRIYRSDGFMLGYVFLMMGSGLLLMVGSRKDMVFPVAGGGFLFTGLVLALFGLMQPARPKSAQPQSVFGAIFIGSFLLLFLGFVFLCGDLGLHLRWMGIVGIALSAPFVIALLMLVWIIPREVRKAQRAAEAK